jgi:uncharacterized protein YbaA (DUF1428 family)
MTYVEGFLTPVPTANKDAYKKHAEGAIDLFLGLGATRFVEAWGDDVPDGKTNDLKKAVDLKDDETVLFSWLEYPNKATRDEANRRMMENPDLMNMDMPFDGSRMIFAGFEPFVEVGEGKGTGYLDGYVLPVPAGNKDAYKAMAEKAASVFRDYGALRVVEAWGEEIPDGKKTDYNRATLRKDDERVVYSWVEWPSKQVRDEAWPKLMEDERMKPDFSNMPFDGQRMMWGGFAPLFDAKG